MTDLDILIIIDIVLETPHVLVASAIAVNTGNPFLAIPLAFLSHFVLDEVPHWNPHITTMEGDVKVIDRKSMKIIIADSSLALIAGSAIALSYLPDYEKFLLVLVCSLMAVLPDLIEAPYIFLDYRKKYLKKWLSFQKKHQFDTNIVWGLTVQTMTIISSLVWIFNK